MTKQLDTELKSKLVAHKREIVNLLGKGKDVLFRLSYELFLMRNTCLEYDDQQSFCVAVEELGMSRSGAYRAIARWETIAPKVLENPTIGVRTSGDGHFSPGKPCPTLGQAAFDGFLCFARFDDSALDELAKSSTPEKAVNAAVKLARAGKGMTKKEALALIAKHQPPPDEPEDEEEENGESDGEAKESPISIALRNVPVQAAEAYDHEKLEAEDVIKVSSLPEFQKEVIAESIKAGEEPKEAIRKATDFGKCPACAGTKWTVTESGVTCSKCSQPHGEPAGDADGDRVKTQRQKTVKTVEALMRAFDDMHLLSRKPREHAEAVAQCKFLLKTAKGWK